MKSWVKQSLTGFFFRDVWNLLRSYSLTSLQTLSMQWGVSQPWSLPSGRNVPDSSLRTHRSKHHLTFYSALCFPSPLNILCTQEVVGINVPNCLHEFTCVSYLTSAITSSTVQAWKLTVPFYFSLTLKTGCDQTLTIFATLTQLCPSLYFFFNWSIAALQCC